jgi:hypothetical protein
MTNLLEETLKVLHENGKSEEDVMWCGSEEFGWFTWEDFKELANLEYDEGFGAQEVARDLVIVGKDFWLERHEYDGLEWWEFKQLPERLLTYRKPVALTVKQSNEKLGNNLVGWETLERLNTKEPE